MNEQRLYVFYDGRAIAGGTEDAIVLETEYLDVAARDSVHEGDYGDGVCYSYRISAGDALSDEHQEWSWTFAGGFSDRGKRQ